MEEALLRILTPRRSIDILRDVHAAKERGRPYVIVFVGVNGVGKSTNLAKVCISRYHHAKRRTKSFLVKFTHFVFI
jgi:signal recognition particle receptor subunit alpha